MATPEQNMETVKRFFDAANTGDLSVLDEIMHEDFVTHGPQTLLNFARGREAHRAGIGGFKQGFPDATINIELIFAENDKVVTRQRVTATHNTAPFMGVEPDGRELVWTATQFMRFNDEGVMVERWVIEDFLGMFKQLGVMPE